MPSNNCYHDKFVNKNVLSEVMVKKAIEEVESEICKLFMLYSRMHRVSFLSQVSDFVEFPCIERGQIARAIDSIKQTQKKSDAHCLSCCTIN